MNRDVGFIAETQSTAMNERWNSMAGSSIRLFGIEMDAVRMADAVGQVMEWTTAAGPCRYVVTPNVDHAVMYQEREDLRLAYRDASLVLADGFPVVVASRLLGKKLPERVAGSDLAPALFDLASCDDREEALTVFLLGAAPGVAERAAQQIQNRWPGVKVVGTYSPPLGFEREDAENERILARIATVRPEVILLGLGAPKQELWVHRHRERIEAKVVLCVGATIDFLAGERSRAPVWMRKTGLEWLHRVASEPRRLLKRYARDAWIFPQLVWREWRSARA
jgi:N-acetylglucosaminyldiphosphoundecaprenol N-acetyl-beta-D-mannosaminyltransferase